MIEYIRGTVADLTPTQAVIEASGVGYALFISLNTYSAVQGKNEAKFYVYESIREDAYQLYGFATKMERDLFVLLISVSGIGGQIARMALSAFTPADLSNIIESGDERSLKSVKGIGPKAAQRILVELKGKTTFCMGGSTSGGNAETARAAQLPVVDEAVQALAVLGFAPAPTQKVVLKIVSDEPGIPVEGIIKKALKML